METITECDPERLYVCDFCARTAEGDAWPVCGTIRKHYCPCCRHRLGARIPPRLATEQEAAAWNESGTTGF